MLFAIPEKKCECVRQIRQANFSIVESIATTQSRVCESKVSPLDITFTQISESIFVTQHFVGKQKDLRLP